jgi:hypothetical protein
MYTTKTDSRTAVRGWNHTMWKILLSSSILVLCIDLLKASDWVLVPMLPSAMTGALILLVLLELSWFGRIDMLDYVHLAASMTLAYATIANSMENILLSTTWVYLCLG